MAQRSYFMNSAPGDPRRYTAQDIARYYAGVFSNGIMSNGTSSVYSARVQAGTMNSIVSPGQAIINGYGAENTEDYTLEHPLAEPTLDRIDRVVLRMNLNADTRKILLFVKPGTPSASPEPPTLQRDAFIWELSLAQVRVRQNTVQLLPADMTDERLITDLCGIVTLNPQIPTDGFQAQWDAFMADIEDNGFASATEFATHKADEAAHGIGDKATLLTTNKTSIVAAMNELFTNANDGKIAVANAVTAKGVPASPTDTFAVLAGKIGQIDTGLKTAIGTATTNNSDRIYVNGLGFKPRFVYLEGPNVKVAVGNADPASAITSRFINLFSSTGTGLSDFTPSNNGFDITVSAFASTEEYKWIAFGEVVT